MTSAMTTTNIHANDPNVRFEPGVRRFDSGGSEFICLDIVDLFHSVFLNRERLHQLKQVLVDACERYPLADPQPTEIGEMSDPFDEIDPECDVLQRIASWSENDSHE